MNNEKIVSILLRLGVAFAFIYPAVAGFITPNDWIGFFPSFMLKTIPGEILLLIFEIFEIALGVSILFMKRPFIPAILAALVLLAIVVLDYKTMDIIFRDISILLMAVALAVLHKKDEG
ncbi:MAG: hypothetical protein AAB507_00255 [Patescibacteria group bacterium]